jgi:hypothetical protein
MKFKAIKTILKMKNSLSKNQSSMSKENTEEIKD